LDGETVVEGVLLRLVLLAQGEGLEWEDRLREQGVRGGD